ncbi:hypothetical protein [Alkalihalobacterium alkalinitrilicum]|uniref:hypothetical protein n=1 Tax=Alkalihalobacterium alkalinitrilicum TaxID=427920 RepID=UPI000994D4D6|nr:hypothetical protein [Alkalihalobacterium alkalinitrilicum]
MDKKDNFDFEEFEKKLRQLPKVEDNRSKEVIYQNIRKQMNTEPMKKRKQWLVPTVASTFAAFLLILLIPMMLSNESNESEEALPVTEEAEDNEMFAIEVDEVNENAATEQELYISALVDDILLENQRIVTVPFVDEQANFIVPVSFIVRDDDAILHQMTAILEEYDPSYIGLSESPLKGVTFEEVSDTTVAVDIPEVPIGSANEKILVEAIKMAIRPLSYSFATVLVNGIEGIDIGQYGPLDSLDVKSFVSGYYFYESASGIKLLVKGPSEETGALDFEENLQMMQSTNQGLFPTIPEEVVIESVVEEKSGTTTITFSNDTDVLTTPTPLMMIEAILLTARDSGIQEIRFENIGVEELGHYKFNDAISTKIYPNGVAYR